MHFMLLKKYIIFIFVFLFQYGMKYLHSSKKRLYIEPKRFGTFWSISIILWV